MSQGYWTHWWWNRGTDDFIHDPSAHAKMNELLFFHISHSLCIQWGAMRKGWPSSVQKRWTSYIQSSRWKCRLQREGGMNEWGKLIPGSSSGSPSCRLRLEREGSLSLEQEVLVAVLLRLLSSVIVAIISLPSFLRTDPLPAPSLHQRSFLAPSSPRCCCCCSGGAPAAGSPALRSTLHR